MINQVCRLDTTRLGLVFSDKPTNISVADRGQEKSVADGGQVADADYLRIVAHKALAPAQKWDEPITTTMEYGWFSQQLVRLGSVQEE